MFPVHFHTLSRMFPTAKDVLEKSNAYKISCTCMLLKMRNKKVSNFYNNVYKKISGKFLNEKSDLITYFLNTKLCR